MKSNALYMMLLATSLLIGCDALQPKKSESTKGAENTENTENNKGGEVYEGPQAIDAYEIASGDPAKATRIVVDKGTLTLKVYDKSNRLICKFPVAVGRIHGNKRCNGDLKTPEGDFKISGKIQDASEWKKASTDDGTERVKGGYGPWFIRLDVPDIASVGICGTLNPELVGLRSSSGNIVMRNEDLDSLRNMINEKEIDITIIPGELDLRADNNYIEPINEESNNETDADVAAESEKKQEDKKVEEPKKKEEAKKSNNDATTDSNGDVWHTIAKGEFISTIADKYDISIATIKRLNPGLNIDKIREGQRIKVYGAEETTSTADNAKAKETKTPGEVWHTVESGEYASKIVSKYGISLSILKELNPGLNVDKIREGQKLRVK